MRKKIRTVVLLLIAAYVLLYLPKDNRFLNAFIYVVLLGYSYSAFFNNNEK